ncbi:hypothetical protein [Actinocatenispora thailandica]|uniref:WXG100-like domain-containing protein n=1 Tax=Actinocatenispora thailandica TaxID=227318 RepID=UPI0019510915|nr:hypothetical protein [Actinocatenispora thailandica]
MSLEFPSWLEWLGWVIGADWPDGDEDAMRRLADAWTAMGTALGDASDNGDQAADLVMTALDAADGRAFDRTWSAYSGDDEAYLSKLKVACDGLAGLCEGCAEDIEYAKYTFYVMLILLAIDIAIMVAAAAATFGGSLAEIAIEEGLTQLAARRVAATVVRQIAERTAEKAAEFSVKELVKEGIKGTLKGELPDAVAQTFMYARGDEKGGWNFARTGNSVLSAGAGAVLGAGADTVGNKTGLGRAVFGDNPLGQAVKGALVGGATPLAVGALPGQDAPSLHDVVEGASGGAAGGALGFAKGKALEWYKSSPDGSHVAIPDADPSATLLASSSSPATDTSTVDSSVPSDAARSAGTADAGGASPAGAATHGGATTHVDSGTPAGTVRTESARPAAHAARTEPARPAARTEPAGPAAHAARAEPAGPAAHAARAEPARSPAHPEPDPTRTVESARHPLGDSRTVERPPGADQRATTPTHDESHGSTASHDTRGEHGAVGGSADRARPGGPEQLGTRHGGDEQSGARHGTDSGATADRPRQAGPDAGESDRSASRTADTAGAGEDRASGTPARGTDAAHAADEGRAGERPGGADDARHTGERARATPETPAPREEANDRSGRGSGTSVNRIDAVLNPPARPARATSSDTATEAEPAGTSARRTSDPAPGRDTTAGVTGRDPAQGRSHPADPANTDRHSRADEDPTARPRTDGSADRSHSRTAEVPAAPPDRAATTAERPTTSPETIGELGYDPLDPGFPDPGDGIDTVYHEGREWVRLADDAGWHRVEFRTTDARYAGKGFAARLRTFVDRYFPPHDGRTAEDLFNEARGKIDTIPPDGRRAEFQRISDDEAKRLAGIRTESQTIVPGDTEGTHRIIQKVVPAKDIAFYENGRFGGITGFVAKLVDVVQLKTPESLFRALRLDYNGTEFRSDQKEIHAVRMKLTEHQAEHELVIPSSERMMEFTPTGPGLPERSRTRMRPSPGPGSAPIRKMVCRRYWRPIRTLPVARSRCRTARRCGASETTVARRSMPSIIQGAGIGQPFPNRDKAVTGPVRDQRRKSVPCWERSHDDVQDVAVLFWRASSLPL